MDYIRSKWWPSRSPFKNWCRIVLCAHMLFGCASQLACLFVSLVLWWTKWHLVVVGTVIMETSVPHWLLGLVSKSRSGTNMRKKSCVYLDVNPNFQRTFPGVYFLRSGTILLNKLMNKAELYPLLRLSAETLDDCWHSVSFSLSSFHIHVPSISLSWPCGENDVVRLASWYAHIHTTAPECSFIQWHFFKARILNL